MKNNEQLQQVKTTNSNQTQCKLCNGVGLIKNFNLYCSKCEAHRCEFTFNMSLDEFYKYKFCESCSHSNTKNSSSTKTHCLKCAGKGYYFNSVVVCNACEISHKVCNCIIKSFDECAGCCGSGIKQ